MGMHPNIFAGNMPRQTDHVDAEVLVAFRQNLSVQFSGTILRDDAEAPFRTIIEVDDALADASGPFFLDATECTYTIVSKTVRKPHLVDTPGGDLEDQGTGLTWLKPAMLEAVAKRGVAYVIVEWEASLLQLGEDSTSNIGPSLCGFDVAAVAWLLDSDNLHYIQAFRESPELSAWKAGE